MKYKFLIGVLLIFLMISVVNAKDISELTNEDLNKVNYTDKISIVELDGFNFTLPTGYGHLSNYDINKTEGKAISHGMYFVNKDNEVIMISTITGDGINLNLDDYNIHGTYKKESINGHEGWRFKDNAQYEHFEYIDEDAVIILQAPDESYFKLMIND